MLNMKRDIIFLFGAGASAFSDEEGSPLPPIGPKLFDALCQKDLIPQNILSDELDVSACPL